MRTLFEKLLTSMEGGRICYDGCAIGDYAIFGPGRMPDSGSNDTQAYSKALTKITIEAQSNKNAYSMASTDLNAIIAGGSVESQYSGTPLEWYDASLTHTVGNSSIYSNDKIFYRGASSANGNAIFAGGNTYSFDSSPESSSYFTKNVISYNSSLTKTTLTDLSVARDKIRGCNIGNYALFLGGRFYKRNVTGSNTVEAYDSSLTRISCSTLSSASYNHAVASNGKYVLAGYYTIDAYNRSLTKTVAGTLSSGIGDPGAASSGGYAIFIGYGYSDRDAVVYSFDASLTKQMYTPVNATDARMGYTKGVSVDDFAIFAGGSLNDSYNYNSSSSVIAFRVDNDNFRKVTNTYVGLSPTTILY